MNEVIKATIVNYIRHKKMIIVLLVIPIILIGVLGAGMTGDLNTNHYDSNSKIIVSYTDKTKENSNIVFNEFMKIGKDSHITFKKIQSKEEGYNSVKIEGEVYIEILEDSIKIYKNSAYSYKADIVEGILEGISNNYIINNKEVLNIEKIQWDDYLDINIVKNENKITSMRYYGVAELGLIIFYYFSIPMILMIREKRSLKDRISITGVSKVQYYMGTFIGCFLISYALIIIIYISVKLLFNINYGNNIIIVPLAILPFMALAIAIGVLLMVVSKNYSNARDIGEYMIIPILCLLGGGYFSLENSNEFIRKIQYISPLKWFNEGIFSYIYGGENIQLISWFIGSAILVLIILGVITIMAKREAIVGE